MLDVPVYAPRKSLQICVQIEVSEDQEAEQSTTRGAIIHVPRNACDV